MGRVGCCRKCGCKFVIYVTSIMYWSVNKQRYVVLFYNNTTATNVFDSNHQIHPLYHHSHRFNRSGKIFYYRKDTEPLYHSFMYSLVSHLSSIYPLPAMHSLLVTLSRFGYFNYPYKRDLMTLNKSVINYLPKCTYQLLYYFCLIPSLSGILKWLKSCTDLIQHFNYLFA